MIFPGGRWMQKHSKCKIVGKEIFKTVDKIDWFPNGHEKNAESVFKGTMVYDGVSTIVADRNVNNDYLLLNGSKIDRPVDDEIVPLNGNMTTIIEKVFKNNSKSLVDRKVGRGAFGLRSTFTATNPDKVYKFSEQPEKPVIENHDFILGFIANETPGSGKRVEKYWVRKDCVNFTEQKEYFYHNWKICGVQGNASKYPEVTNYNIVEPEYVIGESWSIFGCFETEEEAVNYKKYLDSGFARALMAECKGGKIGKWGWFIPDLDDYTNNNKKINWNEPIDEQLFKIFKLNKKEIDTIHKNCKMFGIEPGSSSQKHANKK